MLDITMSVFSYLGELNHEAFTTLVIFLQSFYTMTTRCLDE
jgi:hypothetical protein